MKTEETETGEDVSYPDVLERNSMDGSSTNGQRTVTPKSRVVTCRARIRRVGTERLVEEVVEKTLEQFEGPISTVFAVRVRL
ncbi:MULTISPECIES: hypothetical protein [Natrialbaceae]|uniref:hypothetical protein n=1 Tax=Natrialbaceae TaxID=1644061 RepID=UPI00207C2DB3|nr:hypothetical protein [Natronococcus sp. CG52]